MPLLGAPTPGTVPWWSRDIMGYQPGTATAAVPGQAAAPTRYALPSIPDPNAPSPFESIGGSPSPPILGTPATPATPGVAAKEASPGTGVTGITYGDIMKLLLSSGGSKPTVPAATPATPMGAGVSPAGIQAGQATYNQLWQPKQQGGSTGAILSMLGPMLFA